MKVARADRVQEGEVLALPCIEPVDLFERCARPMFDEFPPAVIAAIEHPQDPEWWIGAAIVEPSEQLLEVYLDGERLGLVDQLESGAEGDDCNRATFAVGIAGMSFDADHRPGLDAGAEQRTDRRTVDDEMSEEFACVLDPLIDVPDEVAREH